MTCFEEVSSESDRYKSLDRKGKTIRILHCQKHFIFGLERRDLPVLIIAIFHEKMDLMNRIGDRLK